MPDFAKQLSHLNDQERLYCESVLRGMNRKAALRAAGYSENANTHHSIDTRPHVAEALTKCRELSAVETGMTRERVSEMLQEAYRNATTAAEQIMAAREIGKLFGLYAAEKLQVDHSHKLEHTNSDRDMKSLSHEELLVLAQMDKGIVLEGQFEVVQPRQLVHSG